MCVQVLTDSLNAVVFRVPLAHVTHVRYTGNQPFPQVSAARPCHDETEGFVFNERRFRICPEFTLINVSDDTHFLCYNTCNVVRVLHRRVLHRVVWQCTLYNKEGLPALPFWRQVDGTVPN